MANKTNSAAQTLSLPQGGGALHGIGERFSPDPHTGTGNFSVPIAVPAGRNGFQPQLSLGYSTGSGNGPYGLGWTLSVPAVSRKTSRGIPRYESDSASGGSDTFVLSDDLVPVSVTGDVTRYRPRTEGQFARIERTVTSATDHWEVRTRDGLVSIYGTPSARAADRAAIADPEHRDDVFSWKLTRAVDPFGNVIRYEYERDTDDTDGHVCDQVYVKRIQYADYTPQGAAGGDGDAFLVSLTFLYEDRPDPFSDFRSGFEIRTRRRCTAIEVRTHTDRERLVRAYRLVYLDQRDVPIEQLPPNRSSLLSQVLVEGYDEDRRESLPPLEFGYTAFEPATRRFQPLGTDQARPDRSLGHPDLELVDLFGNGLPAFVELNEQVRYWRNRGDGAFDRVRTMPMAPAGAKLSDPGVQLLDAEGNGRSDLIMVDGQRTGFYPLNFAGEWDRAGFVPYRAAPTIDLDAPDVRLFDLDGDGVTDALRTASHFELYYNDPEEGWSSAELRERQQRDDFPNVSFTDPRIKLADLTGDGLQDIVRVHDGSVEYWPYRGYGRWGRRVVMRNAPRFDDAALFPGVGFDPKRLLVGDVDGDGAADLVYVSSGHVSIWINQHGYGWSDPIVVHGTPLVGDTAAVRLADMLGNGTDGVLWTYDAGTFTDSTCKFLDLTGGIKPYLLHRTDNQMGAVTEISYAPSTRYYLEDERQSATRWRTPLPFPVQVVSRADVVDRISGGRLSTEFRYHHGYWDGTEREFRGFGMVEQLDTETFGGVVGVQSRVPGLEPRTEGPFSPPLLTRTWFHQGAVKDGHGDWQEPDWSSEYWAGDPPALSSLSGVTDLLVTLPDARDRRDALRTLRGSVLRSELYALDGSDRERRPYTVTEQALGVREESVPGAAEWPRPRIFFPHGSAQRTTQWERGVEPMTSVTLTDDYDEYGQPRRQVSLAVPRHRDYRVAATTASEPYLGTSSETRFATRDSAGTFIVNRVSSEATFEIVNDGRVPLLELYETLRFGGGERRLFAQTFHYYDGDAFVGLPHGGVGAFGALVRSESLVLDEEVLADVYRDENLAASPAAPPYLRVQGGGEWPAEYPGDFRRDTPALAGYVFADGSDHRPRGYYVESTRVAFDFHRTGLPSRGLVVERQGPLGNDTALVFDQPYNLLPVRLIDAAGLVTEAEYDYRVLQAHTVTDINGNRTAVAFSPLGLVTASVVMGKAGQPAGDTLDEPGNRLEYDLFAFAERRQPVSVTRIAREHHVSDTHVPLPARDAAIVTVEYSDGFGRLLQTRTQTDDVLFGEASFGHGVLPGDQAAPSTDVVTGTPAESNAPHVVVSGWQVYDNKGRTVEAYEPFFAHGFEYQPQRDDQLGRKSTMFYDPRGELIRTVNADGSEHRVIHGIPVDLSTPDRFTPTPWEAYSYDANDLAPVSRGAGGAPLTAAAPASHHFTPSSIVVDALGRTILTVARTTDTTTAAATLPSIEELHTASTYDIRGNLLTVTDALDRVAFRYSYDLADRAWRIESLDAGIRRIVLNAVDADLERRDSKGALILQAYDALQRPTRVWARDDADGGVTLRQRMEYGDAGVATQPAADRDEMRQRNLLGQLARQYDEAGLSAVTQADFKGNVLEKWRRVVADAPVLAVFESAPAAEWRVAPFRMDWTVGPAGTLAEREDQLLDTVAYRTTTAYDALGRVTRMQYPDDVEGERRGVRAEYGRGGQLTRLWLEDAVYVERVAYDARGRRTLVAYGNGVLTRYAYDDNTSRLTRYRSERCRTTGASYHPSGEVLQDVGCEYDLAGNIVALNDRAPGSGVRNNPEAAATSDPVLARLLAAGDALHRRFEYDAIYRLRSATGRECDRVAERAPWDDRPRCSDATKARAYTERYTYDPAGNMVRLEHRDGTAGYARNLSVGPDTDQLRRVEIGDLSIDYTFDANGNMRSETTSRHFDWDHVDQLKAFRVQTNGAEPSVHAQYLYGASGERVKKLVRKQGGAIEVTHYVEGVFEHHRWQGAGGSGENNQLHVADGERRIAMRRIGPAHSDDRGPAVQFTLADHLGSSNVVTDAAGALVDREEYTPFGESSFGSFARKRYRFTGCERDEESGLSYHANRYYAPALARWASCDPLGMEGGLNPYAYAANSPIGLVDRSGTQPAAWQQDADGNYIVPGEVISISSAAPAIDELEIQKRAGNSDYQSRSSVERELRYQLRTNASDTSWMKPPPEPDWEAAGLPELAEEARAEAEAKWDAYVTKEYQKRRDANVVELGKQQRRISAANTAGKIIGGVTIAGTLVVGAAAAGVGTGVAALKARGTVFLGQQLVNSGATVVTGSVLYGIATPPGSPDLPGPGDDGGRVVRSLLSRLTNAIATRTRGQREVIANPTFEQVKAMRPWFTTFQRWGGMIWGNGATGARDLINTRTAAQLRQIPNLTIEAAMTLRNWLFQLGTGKGGQAPHHRIELLNHIIQRLQGH